MDKLDDTEIHRIVQNEIDDAVLYQQEERTGFCDLRTTALTNLGNKGATIAEIVTFSGHKINSPVLHDYVKPGREAAIRALNKLETNGE